jgi:Tol biopolymer transport system component
LYQGDEAAPNDVENSRIVWHTKKNILYFAGSPIYGKPGIYKWDIEENKTEKIVKPKNITKAFPDGFDCFILLSISPDNRYLYYYHSPTKQTANIQDIEHLYYVDLKTGKIYKVLDK